MTIKRSGLIVRRFFTTVLVVLFICCIEVASAQTFSVTGSLTNYSYGKFVAQYSFQAFVSDCKWRIVLTPSDAERQYSGVAYYEDAYDGGLVYSYCKFAPDHLATNSANTSSGSIESNDIPASSSLAVPVWLAYASQCYFAKTNANELKNLWWTGNIHNRITNLMVRVEWSESLYIPHIPTQARFFNDGWFRSLDSNGNPEISRFPPPFQDGFLNRQFSILDVTNVGELTLARFFNLKRFEPKKNAQGIEEVQIVNELYGEISEVRTNPSSENFIPLSDLHTLTEEYRFARAARPVIGFTYLNTNFPNWVPITNPTLLEIYTQQLNIQANLPQPVVHQPKNPLLIRIIIALISIVGITCVIILFRNKENRE